MNEERLDRMERKVDQLVGDFSEFRGEVRQRFNTIDEDHARVEHRAGKVDWKTILAFASTVVVPIVVAVIVSGGGA